jgi:hypothetical protein
MRKWTLPSLAETLSRGTASMHPRIIPMREDGTDTYCFLIHDVRGADGARVSTVCKRYAVRARRRFDRRGRQVPRAGPAGGCEEVRAAGAPLRTSPLSCGSASGRCGGGAGTGRLAALAGPGPVLREAQSQSPRLPAACGPGERIICVQVVSSPAGATISHHSRFWAKPLSGRFCRPLS